MTIRLRGGGRSGGPSPSDPFTDLLFNTLIGFMLLFFVAIIFLNPARKTANVDLEAEYLIVVSWADNNPDDVDTWIEDPRGAVAWFRNRSAGLVHLDRDDRGMLNDTIEVNGTTVENPLNQEVAAIRGLVPGEYTVNLHYYETVTDQPVDVSVRVARVNPVYRILYNDTVSLPSKGTEVTAVRFTLLRDGSITGINKLQKQLVTF
jgi:hypothetical protein